MTTNRVVDFESWVRTVEKRITRLERRPLGGGGGGGGIAPTPVVMTGWAGTVAFNGGVATVPIQGSAPPSGVLAGFSATSGESAAIAASVASSVVTLRATVTNGSYPVMILFFDT